MTLPSIAICENNSLESLARQLHTERMMMPVRTKLWLLVLLAGLTLPFALPLSAQDNNPLAWDGPYEVGVQLMDLVDSSRDDRDLQTIIFYPAVVADDAPRPYPPDTTGAPYPLIIYSHGFGGGPGELLSSFNRLVSHGFVVAAVTHPDENDGWKALVERPLDILFLLNQLTVLGEDNPLVGLIDTDNVGVMGTSYGGYTTISVGGARINMDYFTAWCAEHGAEIRDTYCGTSADWDTVTAFHAERHPEEPADESLWGAVTDDRIHAILPIVPCFGQLFGIEGLASVTLPTFIIAGTTDVTCPYEYDAVYYYDHLASPERYLVSLENRDHGRTISTSDVIQQYATAFFGYYLQGETDYAPYLTPESAETFQNATLQAQTGAD
jgi:predicted dienelactone hydrolase